MRYILMIACIVLLATSLSAAVPPMINYQGKLMQPSGAPVPDGTYSMVFAIYDAPTGGTALWSETNPSVQVKGGLFAVLLGSVNNLGPNLFDSPDRFFGVKVGSDPEMTPRQKIASVGFAIKAGAADTAATVSDGAIVTSKMADAAVTEAKVADSAVTTSKIADGGVTAANLADAAVTTGKVADGAIAAEKINSSAISIGYVERNSAFSSTAVASYVDVPGLSVAVNVPSGGRRVKITALAPYIGAGEYKALFSAISCDGVHISESQMTVTADNGFPFCHITTHVPSAGSHTYKLSLCQNLAGTMFLNANSGNVSCILVELI